MSSRAGGRCCLLPGGCRLVGGGTVSRALCATSTLLRYQPLPAPPHIPPPPPQIDLFGESTRGNLHFASDDESDWEEGDAPQGSSTAAQQQQRRQRAPGDDVLGLRQPEDIMDMPWSELRARSQALLSELGVPPTTYPASQPQRALFTNRTINLRAIEVIGYDMDYTCINYDVEVSRRAAPGSMVSTWMVLCNSVACLLSCVALLPSPIRASASSPPQRAAPSPHHACRPGRARPTPMAGSRCARWVAPWRGCALTAPSSSEASSWTRVGCGCMLRMLCAL